MNWLWGLHILDQAVEEFVNDLDSVFIDSVKPPGLDVSLMNLVPLYLQSLQGFFIQLILFLVTKEWSWHLASNLINYDARKGFYFFLCHLQVRCQPPKLLVNSPVILQHIDSGLLLCQVTLFWMLLIRSLITVCHVFSWHWGRCSHYFEKNS